MPTENFVEAKFCQGYALRVQNPKLIRFITNKLTKYYKLNLDKPYLKYSTRLTNSNLEQLTKSRHLAYATFKVPLTRLLLTIYNGQNYCFFIQNSTTGVPVVWSVFYRFSDQCFQNDLLLEGYLLNDRWFLVNDLVIDQKHTLNASFLERLKRLNLLLSTNYQSDPVLDVVTIKAQEFVDYAYLESFNQKLTRQPYHKLITGLGFRPVDQTNTNNLLLSFSSLPSLSGLKASKPPKTGLAQPRLYSPSPQTKPLKLVFKLERTDKPDVYHLYLHPNAYCGLAHVPDLATSQLVNSWFKPRYHYVRAQCQWRSDVQRWQPVASADGLKVDPVTKLGKK